MKLLSEVMRNEYLETDLAIALPELPKLNRFILLRFGKCWVFSRDTPSQGLGLQT